MTIWAWLLACAGETVSTEPVDLVIRLENVSGDLVPTPMFAPGVAVLHDEGWTLFEEARPAADRPGLEALAEDGDNAALIAALEAEGMVVESLAAMLPGDAAVITLTAAPGDRLTVAAMYGESNDVFAASQPGGIALFDEAGEPLVGDVSGSLDLWDAGTEVNQEPGQGADQPARQAAANNGEDEGGVVAIVIGSDRGGFSYPPVDSMLSLTIEVVASADTP